MNTYKESIHLNTETPFTCPIRQWTYDSYHGLSIKKEDLEKKEGGKRESNRGHIEEELGYLIKIHVTD